MTTVVPLNAWAFVAIYSSRVKAWIKKATPVLLEELKSLTPEDTKDMLNSYRTEFKETAEWIVWIITNDKDYAIYVEYWVKWVMFWYHKPKGSLLYVGEWNMTFHRAVENKEDEITMIIYNEVNR